MRRGVFAARELQQVNHIGGEAEAVAELLQKHECAYQREVFGLVIGEDDVECVGDGDARHHRPEPTLHAALAGCEDAAEDAAEREPHDAYRALHEAYLGRGERQAAALHAVEQEEGRYLGEECFRQAIKQHERQGTADAGLSEKADEGLNDVEGEVALGARAFCPYFRAGQRCQMPGGKQEKKGGGHEHHGCPCGGGLVNEFERAGQHDEQALPRYDGNAVEGGAYADVESLLFLRKCQHVEAVGGDVVGRA